MKRHINHDAMAVVGYATPWIVECGDAVDLHLSCNAVPEAVSVRRLDTPQRPIVEWPVQTLDAAPEHRTFDQGSYLRIGRSELEKAGGATGVGFELFLTVNDGTRTLLQAGDIIFISYAEAGGCKGVSYGQRI